MGNKITLFLVGSVFASPLFANEEQEKPKATAKAVPSATVTVTAETDAIEIAKTPNPVVVLDAENISKVGTVDLGKILEWAKPGLLISNGALGSVAPFNINGSRSQDTLIMLDGIRISEPGSLDTSAFSLTGINRLEILSGPASTLYGSDAHGGVISLSSGGQFTDGISGNIVMRTSTLGQLSSGTTAAYGWEDGWLQATGDIEQSPQPTKTENPYRRAAGHASFGQQFGGNSLFTLNHRRQYTGAPLAYNWGYDPVTWQPARAYDYDRESLRWQEITTASVKSDLTGNLHSAINLGNVKHESQYSYNTYSANWSNFQGNVLVGWKQGKGGLTLLADYSGEKYWNSNNTEQTDRARHTAFAIEGSVEAMPALRFVASVRNQSDNIESDSDDYNITFSQTTWKAGVNLLTPSGFRAYINTGTSFNVPNLFQIGYNKTEGIDIPGNERSRSVLAGVGYEQTKWWVRADVSRTNYSEIIDWVDDYSIPTTYGGYYVQGYNIRVQGLEISGGIREKNWNVELFARFQEGRAMDAPEADQLKWFQHRPFFATGMRANWIIKNVDLGLNASYRGHQYFYNSDLGAIGQPDKTHFIDASMYIAIQWSDALRFTLRAEQLFQDGITREDWEMGRDIGRNNVAVVPGYPGFGRAIGLEMRYKF